MKQISLGLCVVLLIVVLATDVYCHISSETGDNLIKRSERDSPNNQYRYHAQTEFRTDWRGSIQACKNKGRRLATVNSVEDNNQVLHAIGRTGLHQEHFWTAGTDQHKEGNWVWETTGQPFTFSFWHPYQPDNLPLVGGENCMGYKELYKIILTGYKWNDKSCDYQAYAICEDYDYIPSEQ